MRPSARHERRRGSGDPPIAAIGLVVAFYHMMLAAPPCAAASMGGAYFVDDADIDKVGACKSEQWASFAANADRVFVVNPACVFNLGRPVELGATAVRTRSDGDWGTTAAVRGKTNLQETGGHGLGYGITGVVTYDVNSSLVNSLFVNLPVSYDVSEALRININAGWLYDVSRNQHFFTTGAGVAWTFMNPFSLIGEVFAIVGPDQANPRFQLGLRYSPIKSLDFDVIYGRNITGERSNWVTLGLNLRTNSE